MYRRRGKSLRIPTPGKNRCVAVSGAAKWPDGPMVSNHAEGGVNAHLVTGMVNKLNRRTHRTGKRIVVVLDNAQAHKAKMVKGALKATNRMVRPFWLPRYSSEELNEFIEGIWKHVQEDYFSRMLADDPDKFAQTAAPLFDEMARPGGLRRILKPRHRIMHHQLVEAA
jgi:DDE superfamily endonuclease